MAKQSGLHQIRGKVGEHSYYKQTGVGTGLIRSINQGMSVRVKTAPEFANTRLNNAEFGQAGRIAKVLGEFITPKYRPMILPFSQSRMCKLILEGIKSKEGMWGQRNLLDADDNAILVNALNSVHKNNPDEWGLTLGQDQEGFKIVPDTNLFFDKLSSIGADGINVKVIAASPWIGTFSADDKKYAASFARGNIDSVSIGSNGLPASVDYEYRTDPPEGWPAVQLEFGIVIILPYREVNNEEYTLQEHCTFFAVTTPSQI